MDTVNPLDMSSDGVRMSLSELEDLYALLVDVGVKRRLRNNDGLRAKDIIRSTVEIFVKTCHLREMEHDQTTEDDSDVLSNDTQSLSGDPDMNDEDEDFDDDATVVEDDDSYSIVDLSESTDRLNVHSIEETPGVIEGWGGEAIIV